MGASKKSLLMFGGARSNSVGWAIAKYFARGGWRVIVCDLKGACDSAPLEDGVEFCYTDLMNDVEIQSAVRAGVDIFRDQFAGMIYAAGYNRIASVQEYTRENWETTLRLNLTAPFLCMQEFLKQTALARFPVDLCHSPFHYVILGSNTSYVAKTKSAAYGASKAGVVHMAACMSRELAPQGYRVTVLNFGPVLDTDMDMNTQIELWAQRGWNREQYMKEIVKNVPLKRFTLPEEIAQVAWFAMNIPAGEMFSGRAINFDGGQQQG